MNKVDFIVFICICVSLVFLSISNILRSFSDNDMRKEFYGIINEQSKQIEELSKENALLKEEIENFKGEIELLILEDEIIKEELESINEATLSEKERVAILDELSDLEWNILYRVARSEAGATSREGQMHVVYVVLNRMESERFSQNTISDVVFAPGQFSVVSNGSFYNVEISDFTMQNVHDAYINWRNGERYYGALFFHSGATIEGREYIIHDEVGHHFY